MSAGNIFLSKMLYSITETIVVYILHTGTQVGRIVATFVFKSYFIDLRQCNVWNILESYQLFHYHNITCFIFIIRTTSTKEWHISV